MQVSSYLKKYKKLSLQTQSQDSKTAESTLTDSNNTIEIFKLLEFFNIWVFWKFRRNTLKTSYPENYWDLSSLNRKQNSQFMGVPWQSLTTEMIYETFRNLLYLIFLKKIWKNNPYKRSYLENYKKLSSQIWRQNSNFLTVPWKILTAEMVISGF